MKCRFCLAWTGPCNAESSGVYCESHVAVNCCSCGKQATGECDHTGQFVCGAPLCDECEGYTDSSKSAGSWGFLNHSHRAKAREPK